MADFVHSSDPPPLVSSCSPKASNPVKNLEGEEDSPTAPIRALVTQSLALSSPVRQIQNQASPPAKSSTQIQNPDESSSSFPPNKTLITPSSVNTEESERTDSEIMPLAQISPPNNNNSQIIHFASTSHSPEFRGWNNRPPRRYLKNPDYQSDEDFNIEPAKPIAEIPWSAPKIEPTGVGAGLDNSGNTCFIASVLQCFTHTVPLLESLRSYKYQTPCNCGNERFCVLQALRDHIALALRCSGYRLTINGFRDNLNYFSPDFQISHQEDAQEFLQSFLDKLERCCLNPRNKPGSISFQDDVNIVNDVFGGRLMSRLHCCNCNSFSDTFEPSLGLSLEIEDIDNLWSALDSFTRVEKLEDQSTCDNCKEKVSKEKQLKLDELPLVATFHLKRFKNDGITMEKIFHQVEFPLELDLLPFMSNNQDPEVSTRYHLYAIVEHIGNGVSFGHYSSYVRSAYETWHSFDDSKVTRVSEDYVLSQNAYMLFYAREGTPWFSTTYEELKPLFDATPLNASPKSVLETTCREECYENVCNNNSNKAFVGVASSISIPQVNYSEFRYQEPQEEVFHSATESGGSDYDSPNTDAFESPKAADESDRLFAETFLKRKPEKSPAANKATINENAYVPVLKPQNQDPSPKRKATINVLKPQNQEPSPKRKAERAIFSDVPVLKPQNQDPSPKRKAEERAILSDVSQPKLKIQKPDSFTKRQGNFQIKRDHLLMKKKKEETLITKPCRAFVTPAAADPKDREIAHSYLKKFPNSNRARMLAAAMDQSPNQKKQISNRRSHRHL